MQQLPLRLDAPESLPKLITALLFAFFPGFAIAIEGFFYLNAPWIGLAGVVLIIGSIYLVVQYSKKHMIKIEISETGINQTGKNHNINIKWKEPHDVFTKSVQVWVGPIPAPTNMKTKVCTQDGRTISLTMAKPEFHKAIVKLSQNALLPELNEALLKGTVLHFGPIDLTTTDIVVNGKSYPLNTLRKIEVKEGYLTLKSAENWISTKIPIYEIPNFSSLYTLLNIPA